MCLYLVYAWVPILQRRLSAQNAVPVPTMRPRPFTYVRRLEVADLATGRTASATVTMAWDGSRLLRQEQRGNILTHTRIIVPNGTMDEVAQTASRSAAGLPPLQHSRPYNSDRIGFYASDDCIFHSATERLERMEEITIGNDRYQTAVVTAKDYPNHVEWRLPALGCVRVKYAATDKTDDGHSSTSTEETVSLTLGRDAAQNALFSSFENLKRVAAPVKGEEFVAAFGH